MKWFHPGPFFVAEAGEQVVTAFFQNTVNPFDELGSILDFYVVEAAHVKNEIKILVFER